jgi:hypothetical protein
MVKIILEDIKIKKDNLKKIPNKEEVYQSDFRTEHKDNFIDDKTVNDYFLNKKNKKEFKKRLHNTPHIKSNYNGPRKYILIIFLVSLLLGCIYFISNIFLNANVEINNKHQVFTLDNKEFTASKNSSTLIPFEIMIVPGEESKSMILTQTQDLSIKAKGQVTLYNEYSTKAQNLPANTYITDNNGKTYTVDKAVSIPGFTTDKDKNITPGSVNVDITAFLIGSVYDGTPTDFTISSFKGTTKFKKIYGKTTTPITGGAQGINYVLGDEDKTTLDTFANSSFKNNLIKKAEALVPPDYILYPDAFKYSYQVNNDILSEDPKVDIKISGILSAVILKESDLTTAIIKSILPDVSDKELKEINISDLSKLSFIFNDNNQIIDKDVQSISFSLNGSISGIWNPDINSLKTNLLGISKNNITSIFKQDPAIVSASVNIFPPWQSYMPDDIPKININIK